jgi:beta-lactamase class A
MAKPGLQRWGILAAVLVIVGCVGLIVGLILDRQKREAELANIADTTSASETQPSINVQPQVAQPSQMPQGPPPPAALAAHISALGRGFDGNAGIAVLSIDDGWIAGHNQNLILPQQSVSKLWVAMSTLALVDKGALSLTDRITLTEADLTIFHQPVRKYILERGSYTTTIGELMRYAIAQSDNTANDALCKRAGGQAGITAFLQEKALGAIAIGPGEKILQTEMAGMQWNPAYSYGRTFWQVRNGLSPQIRANALTRYLKQPPDGASAEAIVHALAKLYRGELLSRASSAFLIDLMNQSKTGPDRLRGGLIDGWTMAHKTGTGQVLGSFATAYNDVGILRGPSGRAYVLAVMIGSTNQSVKVRQEMMQAVTRGVIALEADNNQRSF